MMTPGLSKGANTAERVPMTTRAFPSRILRHSSYRSRTLKELWSTATSRPKWRMSRSMSWGVRAISGTRYNAVLPDANARAMRWR